LYIFAIHISTNDIIFYLLAVYRSRSDSNQPEPLSIELPQVDDPPVKQKTKRKEPTKKQTTIPMAPLDSPAMGTRSKRMDSGSPAMSTRSKRRLSL
jgi:hypothetical protein